MGAATRNAIAIKRSFYPIFPHRFQLSFFVVVRFCKTQEELLKAKATGVETEPWFSKKSKEFVEIRWTAK